MLYSVRRDCRINRLHLYREVSFPPNECRGYETKPSSGGAIVQELLWMWSRLPLHSGPLWRVVTAKVPFVHQIKVLNHLLYLKLFKCATHDLYQIVSVLSDIKIWNYLNKWILTDLKMIFPAKCSLTYHINKVKHKAKMITDIILIN